MTEFIRALADGRRPRPRALVAPLVVVALLCVAALAVGAAARTEPGGDPRTVTLVARDMAFYLADGGAANPRLVVGRGERVRFVLRNEDPGMEHDFAVPALGEATRMLRDPGTSADVVVRMPDQPGLHEYECTSHRRMMRGVLEVR